MISPALRINKVTKSFEGQPVLHDLNLAVGRGELLSLLGPSGSGKTTLLRIIAGLETADSGSITYEGKPLSRGQVSYVFQKPALYPHLTVRDNIMFGTRLKRYRGSFDTNHYRKLLEILALEDLERRHPAQLSGGQAQRVGLARALVRRSSLVLFDEPLASVDEDLSASIRSDIEALHRELEFTALFITHHQDEALQLGRRVAVLERGRIVQVGGAQQLLHAPVSPTVARLISPGYNTVSGQWEDDTVSAGVSAFGWRMTDSAGGVALPVRVETVSSRTVGSSLSVQTLYAARVPCRGSELGLAAGTVLRVVLAGVPAPAAGSRIFLLPPGEGFHLFGRES